MSSRAVRLAIVVAALGYFVDIYDLLLFSIVRIPSLKSLGVSADDAKNIGIHLLNVQMFGMLIGGILWGILGDRKGRTSVLLGSILMYSIANILNGFVQNVGQYEVLRFVSGIGLAGELGAGITLVSEIMGKHERGYGTMIVASVGVLGAVFAALIAERFAWRTAYFIGGGLGLSLLALRVGVLESKMFQGLQTNVARGNFWQLFLSGASLKKYLSCILVGLPLWFVIGILITLAPELSKALGIADVTAGKAVLFSYSGLAVGDFCSGWFSQKLRSRRKVIGAFLGLSFVLIGVYVRSFGISASQFYALCFALGFASGYWALFVTNGAEQFGTNIRATVATTVPNFVRGAVPLMTLSFTFLQKHMTMLNSALLVGWTTVAIAFLALLSLRETYGKDLDYIES